MGLVVARVISCLSRGFRGQAARWRRNLVLGEVFIDSGMYGIF